jgi:hypothetical protein
MATVTYDHVELDRHLRRLGFVPRGESPDPPEGDLDSPAEYFESTQTPAELAVTASQFWAWRELALSEVTWADVADLARFIGDLWAGENTLKDKRRAAIDRMVAANRAGVVDDASRSDLEDADNSLEIIARCRQRFSLWTAGDLDD